MNKSLLQFLTILVLFFSFMACRKQTSPANELPIVPHHVLWDSLLKTHVDNTGLVSYQGFIKDSLLLDEYLLQLTSNPPSGAWTNQDQLAYWINLYNAATIKLVTQHYPIQSIKDIGSSVQIPFVNTPWQIEFIEINGEVIDLDDIEHGIVREDFNEPRIHFAMVCAALSCPKLRNEAYTGDQLDRQLTSQIKIFLTDNKKNNISADQVVISKLFRWYGDDFKKNSTLIEYLNKYSPVEISKDAAVDFMDYGWALNAQ